MRRNGVPSSEKGEGEKRERVGQRNRNGSEKENRRRYEGDEQNGNDGFGRVQFAQELSGNESFERVGMEFDARHGNSEVDRRKVLVMDERAVFSNEHRFVFKGSRRNVSGKDVGKRIRGIFLRFPEKRNERKRIGSNRNGTQRVYDVFSRFVFSRRRPVADHGAIRRDGERFHPLSRPGKDVRGKFRRDVLLENDVHRTPCGSGKSFERKNPFALRFRSHFGADNDVAVFRKRFRKHVFVIRTVREDYVDSDSGSSPVFKRFDELGKNGFRKTENAEIGFFQFGERLVVYLHDNHFS